MIVVDFTPPRWHLNALGIVAVDQARAGVHLEPWTAEHFRRSMPEKWILSALALERRLVLGYRIVSRRSLAVAWSHRLVTHAGGIGVGARLLEATHDRAREAGALVLATGVAVDNVAALRFFDRAKYATATAPELSAFLPVPMPPLRDHTYERGGRWHVVRYVEV